MGKKFDISLSDSKATEVEPIRTDNFDFSGYKEYADGNWDKWIDAVLNIDDLIMADGAFSQETDPDAIIAFESFYKFRNTGVILNARIIDNLDVIEESVKRIWTPGMKLIVVTYCKTPEEQEEAYYSIHKICSEGSHRIDLVSYRRTPWLGIKYFHCWF